MIENFQKQINVENFGGNVPKLGGNSIKACQENLTVNGNQKHKQQGVLLYG